MWGEKRQMKIKTPADVARAIKTHRHALELTQQEVAEAVGITRQSLARIERGHGGSSFETILRIFNHLGVDLISATAGSRTSSDAKSLPGTEGERRRSVGDFLEEFRRTETQKSNPLFAAMVQAGLTSSSDSPFLRAARDSLTHEAADRDTSQMTARLAALDAAIAESDPDAVEGAADRRKASDAK